MKRLILPLAVLVFLSGVGDAPARNADCGRIRDPDLRYYCLAFVEKRPSLCRQIREDDLRWHCAALLEKKHSLCGFIRDADRRNLCSALVAE